jgi:hypothetical protein
MALIQVMHSPCRKLAPPHQVRQLGDIGRNAPGFVLGHEIGRGSAPRFFLVVHVSERLTAAVAGAIAPRGFYLDPLSGCICRSIARCFGTSGNVCMAKLLRVVSCPDGTAMVRMARASRVRAAITPAQPRRRFQDAGARKGQSRPNWATMR